MPMRDAGPKALALRRPPAKPGHVGGGPRLVDEDEVSRVEVELALEPGLAPAQDLRPLLLAGVGSLFLNVRPARSRTVQIVPTNADIPPPRAAAPASQRW